MVSKKRSRYVMIDKNAMILKLEENLHTGLLASIRVHVTLHKLNSLSKISKYLFN